MVARGPRVALLLPLFLCGIARADGGDSKLAAGLADYKSGHLSAAISELRAAIDTRPTVRAALYLGSAYIKLGNLSAARAAFGMALKIDPATPKRDGITALIDNIDARLTAQEASATAASGSPAPPEPRAAPPRHTGRTSASPPVAKPDEESYVACDWTPYKDAWACELPSTFVAGRFYTPPEFGSDDDSVHARREAWKAARAESKARSRLSLGVFVPRGTDWLFVPGPTWSPHDEVSLPGS